MLSHQVVSILKSVVAQISSTRLTPAEEERVEQAAQELKAILDSSRLRAY